MLPSVRFDQYANDVTGFLNAYRTLWQRVGTPPEWGLGSVLDGIDDPTILVLVDSVSLASGQAHAAVQASGFLQQFGGRPFDPIADWRNSFRSGHPNTCQLVDNQCQQIIGHYRQLAGAARDNEKGVAGAVARFVRFPAEVREAAGFSNRAARGAAIGVGVFLQGVAVSVVAGVIVFLIHAAV